MKLKEYRRKRDFRRTPEPAGNGAPRTGLRFVVQKHAARRLHYDFRLELDGVLKSWAVPKGPSLDPAVKALAVHVEDHPLEYATFEGVIPQGEYGGGTVMVWDHGTWKPDGDPRLQYRDGKLSFQLHGDKLHGGWTLVRMSGEAGQGGKNWLLMKRPDKAARKRSNILNANPRSALSGRPMRRIAADADRIWHSNGAATKTKGASKDGPTAAVRRLRQTSGKKRRTPMTHAISRGQLQKTPGARRAKLPAQFKPQLATLAAEAPQGDQWLHELKFDGYRLLAFIDSGTVRLITRNGNDWTPRFGRIADALRPLPVASAILDGEIVSLNDEGLSDFQELQNLLKRGNDKALVYYLFDVPYLDGYDLTRTALVERKKLLAQLLTVAAPDDGVLRYSDHMVGQGADVLAHACRYGMEGIVSKRADSPYRQFRSPAWLKVKCLQRQEFVIGGYTRPGGSRVGFGALLLGYYQDGDLQYAGRVGTGFTHDALLDLKSRLKQLRTDSPPFANPPRGSQARGVTWVQPALVGEVEFTEWTSDGLLRHPSFQGLREDKRPTEIVREVPRSPAHLKSSAMKTRTASRSPRKAPARRRAATSEPSSVAGVRITHPDRVLYPEQNLTKLQLAEYYEHVADRILPHLANRPLTLVRCPEGRMGECFYQKHLTESLPDALRGVTIQEKGRRRVYIALDNVTGLISLVQMGVLEIHPWLARADQLERPDRIVFDLDPGPGVDWPRIVDAAREIRRRLEDHGLQSFVLTSGGKGLHVIAPIKPSASWDDLKTFAKSIADGLVRDAPSAYIATASKAKRQGKIFIDYLRNSRGATSIAPYSTRARPGAPVAVPVRWQELSRVAAADQYTVSTLPRRLASLKTDPWHGFFKLRQSL